MTSSARDNFVFLDHLDESEMRFHIEGVRCQKCLAKIYKLREELPGILDLHINMGTKQLLVRTDKKRLKMSLFADSITQLGFELHPLQTSSEAEEIQKQKNRRSLIGLAVAAAATGNIMLLSTANYAGATPQYSLAFDWLSLVLFMPILIYSAQPFWQNFSHFIKTKTINIDLTIITAVFLGTAFSAYNLLQQSGSVYFDSMAMLLLLLLASRFLLERIQHRFLNTNYLTPLLLETAIDVWVPSSSSFESRPVKNLKRGDKVQLYKDQALPIDGKLISDSAYLNTAVLSGESKPQHLQHNEKAYAGSRVLSESIQIQVEKVGSATRIGQLLNQLSEQIQTQTQLTAYLNKIAQIFTISIISLAAIILLFFAPFDFAEGIQRALALVILACPCALALAVPLTQSLGLMKASKEGIIIKDGNVLHNLPRIKNFVFDKTGTLTKGEFEFIKWKELSSLTLEDSAIIYALESKARHPIAKALVKVVSKQVAEPVKIENWKEVFGQGVSGSYNGHEYQLKAAPEEYTENSLSSCVGYYKDKKLIAVAYFGDSILPQAKKVVQRLSKSANVYLLSGDNYKNVNYVADALGISPNNIVAKASPEQKVELVKSLNHCAMVGDGANDAVALSHAEMGLAVKGSMAASLKAANVYFTVEGIEHFHKLLDISVLFEKTVRGHMWFSAIYNTIGAAAAIIGLINPLIAALLMPASSLTVLLTSLWGMKSHQAKPPKRYQSIGVHS